MCAFQILSSRQHMEATKSVNIFQMLKLKMYFKNGRLDSQLQLPESYLLFKVCFSANPHGFDDIYIYIYDV